MKQFILPVFVSIFLLQAMPGNAQSAKLDDHFSLQLTAQMLESKTVQFDISGLNFSDEASAQKFFHSIQNNLVSFTVDYAAKTATMNLFPERLGNQTWTLDQWNSYLGNTSQRCTQTYQSFSNL